MQTNKLREALERILGEIRKLDGHICDQTVSYALHSIMETATAALAEPVKNCEVGTPEEQLKRFKDFCRIISKDETCDGCSLLPQCSTLEHCTLKWAQMPYEEGGDK